MQGSLQINSAPAPVFKDKWLYFQGLVKEAEIQDIAKRGFVLLSLIFASISGIGFFALALASSPPTLLILATFVSLFAFLYFGYGFITAKRDAKERLASCMIDLVCNHAAELGNRIDIFKEWGKSYDALSLKLAKNLSPHLDAILSLFPNLTKIDLSESDIDDTALEKLTRCKELKTVILESCKNVTGNGLTKLSLLPIVELDVSLIPQNTGDLNLAFLNQFRRLTTLTLSHLSDADLSTLGSMLQLKELTVTNCPELKGDQIGILHFINLVKLSVGSCPRLQPIFIEKMFQKTKLQCVVFITPFQPFHSRKRKDASVRKLKFEIYLKKLLEHFTPFPINKWETLDKIQFSGYWKRKA